jgi:phosphatidylserine decarboxylase
VERETGKICTEPLFWDRAITWLYADTRERNPAMFRALTSGRASSLLAFLNYDMPVPAGTRALLSQKGSDLGECVDEPENLGTLRGIFERRIRYWECRPMPIQPEMVVSPADSKVILGSLSEQSALFLKEKFFHFAELIGEDKSQWVSAFRDGDFAVFRLTPEKYHYNHTPVSGVVEDFYEIQGGYHSCNPGAVVNLVTPYSKNKRVVTVINTDVPGGSNVGRVAMIEVVALMIGDIVQVYSADKYECPRPMSAGMFLKKGAPKSLFRPGSSTDVVLFQRGRIRFAEDLIRNMNMQGVQSRFSTGFGRSLVETDLKVRSLIAMAAGEAHGNLSRGLSTSYHANGIEHSHACVSGNPPGADMHVPLESHT